MSDKHIDEIFNGVFDQHEAPETQTEEHLEQETVEEQEVESPEHETQEVEHVEAPVEEEEKDHRHVPLPTFLDMRDKMKEQKAEADFYKRQLEQFQEQSQQQPQVIDPYVDPVGFQAQVDARVEARLWDERVKNSYAQATQKHDAEEVQEAVAWATAREANDPHFTQQLYSQADPVSWVFQQHKAATIRQQFESDPIAAARKIAEEQGWLQTGTAYVAPAPATQKAVKTLPKSLTGVPAATKATNGNKGDEQASFNAIFDR